MCVPMCCIVKNPTKITPELEKQFFNFKGLIASSELEKKMFSIQDFSYALDPYIRHPNLHFGITFCSDYLLLLSSEKNVGLKSTIIELSCQTHCIQTTARLPPLTVIWLRIYTHCVEIYALGMEHRIIPTSCQNFEGKSLSSLKQYYRCLNAICRQ